MIEADFSREFRAYVVQNIKHFGVNRVLESLLQQGFHPSFSRAIVRSIVRKEGW